MLGVYKVIIWGRTGQFTDGSPIRRVGVTGGPTPNGGPEQRQALRGGGQAS